MIVVHKSGLNPKEREKIMKPYMLNSSELRDYSQLNERIQEYIVDNKDMINGAIQLLDSTIS